MRCKKMIIKLVHVPRSWAGKPHVYACKCGAPDCTGYQMYSATVCSLDLQPCNNPLDCPFFEEGQPQVEVEDIS